MCVSMEQENVLIHCRNIAFIYHSDFSKYMKIDEVTSEDIFYYLFEIGAENFVSENEKR